MHDTGELQQFLVDGLPFLIINSLTFIVVGAIMLSLNWKLSGSDASFASIDIWNKLVLEKDASAF